MKYRSFFRMLRLMDANLDRLSEGLRVLEDIARFVLGDVGITEELKRLRHEVVPVDPVLQSRLLAARDSGGDVGRPGMGSAGSARESLNDLVTANAKRAQEALRVLEEFAKLPEIPSELGERNFEQARFKLYGIEKELSFRVTRQDRGERISGLYVIIDAETLAGRSEAEATRQAIDGGAEVIQFRDKHRSKGELLSVAQGLQRICARADVLFIVNDHVDIAVAVGADGIHLGQTDLPVAQAREIMYPEGIIGCSVHTVEQARKAEEEGADYLGIGAMFPSPTKADAEVVGVERLHQIREKTSMPIVVLGGINESNIGEVLKHGADSVAVIGAVIGSSDIRGAANRLVSAMSKS